MSPEVREPSSPDVGAPPERVEVAPPPTRVRRRPWGRWLLLALGAVTLVVIVLRLIAWVTIPIVLDRLAHSLGLDLKTRDVSLSLLGGEVELADVRAVARGGEPRVLDADYVRADLAVLPLLRGDVVLDRVEVEGVDVLLDRGLRDRVDVMAELDRVLRPVLGPDAAQARAARGEDAAGDEPAEQPRDRPVHIELPVEVRRLVVRHLRVGLRDPLVTPPVDVTVDVTLELQGLEVGATRPTRVALTLEAPGVIEQLTARGLARLGRERLEAALRIEAEGLHPGPVTGWLDELGVHFDHHTLSLEAHASAALRPALLDANDLAATFTLDRLVVTGNGERVLAADRAHLEIERLLAPGFECRRLEVTGVRGRVVRAERTIGISGVTFTLPSDREEEEEEPDAPVVLREVVVRDVEALYQDVGVPGGLAVPVRVVEGRLRGASSRRPERAASVELQLQSPGNARDVSVRGDVWLFAPRRGVVAQVEAHGLTLGGLRPMLAHAGLSPSLRDGDLSATVRVLLTTPEEDARPAAGWPITITAHLEQLRLVDAGVELLAVDLLDAPALRVDPAAGHVLVEEVTLRGPRAALRLDPRGDLHVAGLVVRNGGPAAPPATPDAGTSGSTDLLRWRLQVLRLDVAGVQATLVDEDPPGIDEQGPATLAVSEAGALMQGLDLELAPPDVHGPAGPPARVAVWVEAPGVVERLELDGTADAGRGRVSIELALNGRGVTLDALRPYLAQVGVEPTFEDAHLGAEVEVQATRTREGMIAGAAVLRSARLVDGGQPLLVASDVRADGARAHLSPGAPAAFGVDRLSLRRLELPVRLAADGAVTALGLRFGRVGATTTPDGDEGGAAWAVRFHAPLVPLPRLQLGSVDVERATVRIHDERRADSERDLPLELELAAGALDFDPLQPNAGAPTPVALRLEAPGAVDVMRLKGEVALAPDLIRVEALLTAHGLTDRFVSSIPGLHTQDMIIAEGHARLRAAAVLYRTGDVLAGRAAIGGAALVDRTGELLGLDEARLEGFTVGPAGVRVTDVDVSGPRARIVRAPGGVRVGGLWIPTEGDGPDAPVKPASGGGLRLPDLPPVLVDRARVTGLEVEWSDLVTTPLVRQPVELDLVAQGLSTIAGVPPGTVRLVARAPGAVDRLVIGGRGWLHASAAALGLSVEAEGVRGDGLVAYVPGLDLKDGRVQVTLEAQARELDDGGIAARLDVRDLVARDGDRLLAHVPLVALDAPRLHPARRIEVARLVAEVARLDVARGASGLWVGGLPLGAGAQGPTEDRRQGSRPAARVGAPPPPITRPLVRIGLIDVQVGALRLVDRDAGRVVAVGKELHLRTQGPFEVLGTPGRERPRPAIELTGGITPVVEAFRLRLAGDPLTLGPQLDLELEAAGLRGEGITELAPALADRLDGAGLEDGHLRLAARVVLRTRRSDPLDFSFVESGFGGRVELTGLDLRDGGPRGRRLAAVDQIIVDVDRFAPGDAQVDVRLAEVFRPRFVVTRVPEGWRAAGLVIKPGPEAPPEQEEDATRIHVRQLSIMGLAATFRDQTVSPPFVVPLRGVELQVMGIDTAALQGRAQAPRPLTFSLLAFANQVTVPERPERGLARLRGVWSTIVGALGGEGRRVGSERVPLFQELSARGFIQAGPDPTGRVRLSVRDLELRGLIGLAGSGGVDLSDGLADLDAIVTLGPAGEADAQVGAVFENLSLTEPRDGPIQRLLRLPASLDALLFVLRDDQGRIRISVDAEVPPDGELERGEVLGAVLEALGEQFARALRSAPLRILSPIVSLIDLLVPGELMGWRGRRAGEPVAVSFTPGSAELTPAAWAALGDLARRLEQDRRLSLLLRHELGVQDEATLTTTTRPSREHDRALVIRLQRRREELGARRADLDAQVRTAFAAGRHEAAQEAVAEAQRVDADIGRVEAALFAAEDRLGTRLDRAMEQRARAAAQQLADARLRVVRQALCDAGAGVAAARRVRLGPGQYFAAPDVERGAVIATPQRQLVEQEEPIDIIEEGERPEVGPR